MNYITLTLNPTLDIDYRFPAGVILGGLNRAPLPPTKRFSGKGINISRALRRLADAGKFSDFQYYAVFLSRGDDGNAMSAALTGEGISISPVPAGGGVRTNIAILGGDEATEINDPGLPAAEEEIEAAVCRVTEIIEKYGGDCCLFLAGSLPPGCDVDTYAALIRAAKKAGATVALDCDGEAMRRAVAECPYIVKPNRSEIFDYAALCMSGDSLEKYRRALFSPDSDENYRAAAGEMAEAIHKSLGVNVLCTLDSSGSVYAADELYEAPPRRVEAKSFKGAGDSFLAAFMWSMCGMGLSPGAALEFAGDFAAKVISE